MLIHGIGVVHVVLHLGDDTAEIRDEAAQKTGFVHFAQHDIGSVAMGQDFEENLVRRRIFLQLMVNHF